MSRQVYCVSLLIFLSGCTSLPKDQGYREAAQASQQSTGIAPIWSEQELAQYAPLPEQVLSLSAAKQLAFAYNPTVRMLYAEIGIARSDLEQSRRLSNPSLALSALKLADQSAALRTQELSIAFTELLMLSTRKHIAEQNLDRQSLLVGSALFELAGAVEIAWYESVASYQIADLRQRVALSASTQAKLADQLFAGGNISRLQHRQELAHAATAKIQASDANIDALQKKQVLATLVGLPMSRRWQPSAALPMPHLVDQQDPLMSADALLAIAQQQRADLRADQIAVQIANDALRTTKRWRWLPDIRLGWEREREMDGSRIRGPSVELELPIFDQQQSLLELQNAQLQMRKAELLQRQRDTRNRIQLQLLTMQAARANIERYQGDLLPAQGVIVAETKARYNFMLIGAADWFRARQEQFDTYQDYLEAIRDYALMRVALRQQVGGALPDDSKTPNHDVDFDSIELTPQQQDAPMHQHSNDQTKERQ